MDSGSGREWFGRAEAAITGLALVAATFWLIGEDTEASLFGLAFLGMVAARVLGMPRNSLFVLTVTIAVLVSTALLGGFRHSVVGSTLSHFVISGLLAWGLSEPVWSRLPYTVRPGSRRAVLMLVAVVLVLGACWEIGEYVADSLLGTALSVRFTDIASDLVADGLGGLVGALAAMRLSPLVREPASPPSRA